MESITIGSEAPKSGWPAVADQGIRMLELSSGQMFEVERFAETLGVDAVVSDDRSVNFVFERLGVLSIQPGSANRVVVSLARRVPHATPRYFDQLLKCAGVDPVDGTVWHAAITDDGDAIMAIDLQAMGLSASDIDAALSRLATKFEALA